MTAASTSSLSPCAAFSAGHQRCRRATRASTLRMSNPPGQVDQKRVTISNPTGEKLVGVFDDNGSQDTIVLCHGFRSSKESSTLSSIASRLVETGYTPFRFDFSGNGESEGEFQYGNYWKEVEDLRSVILFLTSQGHKVKAIVGHSKGGNVVLLYASKYSDVSTIVNLSGRFNLQRGVKERLGERGLELIEKQGFVEIKGKNGEVEYIVTEKSLRQRLNTDMKSAVLSIPENFRVLTVHGSEDKIVNVEEGKEFDKFVLNHSLHIVEDANHGYTQHRDILAELVIDFIQGAT